MTLLLALLTCAAAIAAWHALILLAAMWGDWLLALAPARGRAVAATATARLARLLPAAGRGEA